MTIKSVLVKRRALHKGEVGLFPNNPMAEDDLALAKMDEELICEWHSPRTLEQLKFLWGLVYKAHQNCDLWLDKDKAMEDLKTRVHYTKMLWDNKEKQMEIGRAHV